MSSDFLFKPYVILTVDVAIQSFHMLQHMVQVIQKFVLQFPIAHGILGASNGFPFLDYQFKIQLFSSLNRI